MLLYIPPDTDMELPIGDDPQGGPGPDVAKVDAAATLFYKYGHAGVRGIYAGGQTVIRSDRTWLVCVRDTSGPAPAWVLYAVVDRPTGLTGYKTEPVSAVEFAHGLTTRGRTVVVRKYDDWEITYDLGAESVPL
ncbi:hypothetical protein [Nonomuraea sp. B19D2]|uniref:hypothetical protein n=1 Tax=Nonomuraea sp. B19D2 TaxID=3159561 RepID=UPI0032DBAD45